ncbi:MAG TPA: DUF885 domain-containing protein [Candidatus Limnocylindrales bacterium]|nr:DUF885 domain-containing protein [Candidatus Limnocylindrales bacterium]
MIEEPSARLAALAARYWEGTLAFSPLLATYLGDRRFDDRLDDRSDEAITAHDADLATLTDEIGGVPADALVGEDRITRSALLAQIRRDRAELAANLGAWTVDPLEGPQIRALDLAAIQIVATPDQGRAMVDRWFALGPWLDAHTDRLRRGVGEGRVAVRAPVEKVLEQLDTTLVRPDDELPLLDPLAAEHGDWPAADRAAFEDGLRAAVREAVRPALVRYRDGIQESILPAARSDDRPGLVHVPGGREIYTSLIELHTSLPLGADEIHAIGLDEVARIDDELATLGERVLGTADLAEIRRRLRTDPAMHFATRDEVFACAQESLERAQAAVSAWFGIQPRADCVVVRMQAHEERHSTIAYYREPAIDGSRPGQYYINTSEPATRPRYEAEALAFHEAVPGHHLQLAIGQELTGLPDFRRHSGPTAYVEGWGLYTERLCDDMGLYSGDLDRIGVLSFDAWRACRLVVDTGMHALGWTRRQAIEFMVDHTVLAENNVTNEVDRYITWPGQALAYKIGQREILRLRDAARRELGARFDIRGFHDAVLGHGAIGLDTLGEIVGDWVAGLRSNASPPSA